MEPVVKETFEFTDMIKSYFTLFLSKEDYAAYTARGPRQEEITKAIEAMHVAAAMNGLVLSSVVEIKGAE